MISTAPLLRRFPWLVKPVVGFMKAYAALFKHRFLVERRMGCLFLLDQLNGVDRHLMARGQWEMDQLSKLTNLARQLNANGQATIFIDVGAHGALYSILMSKTGLFDRVIAFEPEPRNGAQLMANLLLNDMIGEVEFFPLAAADISAKIPFYVAGDNNRGASRMNFEGRHGYKYEISVDAEPLDNIFNFQGYNIVCKIDVEGAELKVLKGMKSLLERNRSVLQIEIFSDNVANVRSLLDSHGYCHVGSIKNDHYFENKL